MIRICGNETFRCDHHRRQRTFHVCRTAPVQHAVAQRRLERTGHPQLVIAGRHDIGMTGKGQRFTFAACGPEIQGIAKMHGFHVKASGFEAGNHNFLTASVIRAEGRAAD